ncbi:hypothetical protein KEM56_000012 [Ascosphaera pollenicola]|nr:hypothetical protein KEM56_000012 [Ascosphaera pollenicola]
MSPRKNGENKSPHLKASQPSYETPIKVVVIGAGSVGSSTAFALLLGGLSAEIVLIDVDETRCDGQVLDLNHAAPFAHATDIKMGDYHDCKDAAIIVFAAGKNQKPGQSRMELLKANAGIIRSIMTEVAKYTQDSIVIMATNPVDVLTWVAWKASGFPKERVIGSGTMLDTARLRVNVGHHFEIDPTNVHVDIVGEHGDTELALWSSAHIAGMPLDDFCQQSGQGRDIEAIKSTTFAKTKGAAGDIIKKKGVTDFAIAATMVKLIETILRDEHTITTVSTAGSYAGVADCAVSIPRKLNRSGAHPLSVKQWPMDEEETRKFQESAKSIGANIDKIRW